MSFFKNLTSAELVQKFDTEWSAFSKYVASHPKTGIVVSLIAGFVLAHFV